MHEYLAGIGPNPNQPGFKHIIMRPHPVGDLRSAAATYRAAYGRIVSAWKRDGARFTWNVEIPPNTTATLHVPAKKMEDVTESGKPAAKRAGLKYLGLSDGRAIFQLESGKYTFVSNW
jgi:alpha-L-rhamnosidase